MIITIDGPVASGKSTIASMLAKKLGFYYINTGFLYRSLAYVLLHEYGYQESNIASVKQEDILAITSMQDLEYCYVDGAPRVLYKHQDISGLLKTEQLDRAASIISANPIVRSSLLHFQRYLAQSHDIVVEGRDTGTVVFPDAQYKFFLTASLEIRAQRWLQDQRKRGNFVTLQEAMTIIQERDQRDCTREHAPLCQPSDGIVIDSSALTLSEVVQKMFEHIKLL